MNDKYDNTIDRPLFTTTYGYCACGGVSTSTNALGQVTQTFYDLAGNVISTHFPDGSWITNLYDTLGQLTATLNSSGNRITNAYTLEGALSARSNTFGQLSYSISDIEGHVVKQWDAAGALTTNVYDALGRLVLSVQDSSQGKIAYAYDNTGLVGVTNYHLFVTTFQNDQAGRRIREGTPNGDLIYFYYSPAGDLVRLQNEKEEETVWSYDEYGNVTNKSDIYGGVHVTYRYDANGQMTNRWTPGKGHTFYAYDAIGNLTNVDYGTSPDLRFRHDALGRITNMVDGTGATLYSYDVAGNLIQEDGPWSGDAVTFTYSNRLRSTLTIAAIAGVPTQAFEYAYDSMERLSTILSPAGTFSNAYWLGKPTHLLQRITLPGGSDVTNWYDARGWLVGTALKNSAGVALDSYSYTRPSGGAPEISRMTRGVDGSTVDYTYDSERAVKSARGKEAGGADRLHEQFGYVYDEAGNLTLRTNGVLVQTFDVNHLNQLTEMGTSGDLTVAGMVQGVPTNVLVNGNAAELYADKTFARRESWVGGANNTFVAEARDASARVATETLNAFINDAPYFVYDANGNLLTDGPRHFTWDDENQLTSVVVTNKTKSEFAYDGKMRRRIRKEHVWQNTAWHHTEEVRYVYDGNLVVQERHYDPRVSTALPQRSVSYTRGLDLSQSWQGAGGIGGLLARTESVSGGTHSAFYHADMVGNVTALVDANQQIVARYIYEPFGSLLGMSGPLATANLYRFSSKEAHEQSRLVYYLYRYYEPQLQKWMNRDPIGEAADLNLYGFVHNAPVHKVDLFGLAEPETPLGTPIPGSENPNQNCMGWALKRKEWLQGEPPSPKNRYPRESFLRKEGCIQISCASSCAKYGSSMKKLKLYEFRDGTGFHVVRYEDDGTCTGKFGGKMAYRCKDPDAHTTFAYKRKLPELETSCWCCKVK